MALFTDQLDRTIEIKNHPKRIVSLVPSQSELLYDLGLEEKVVGITKFCVHPQHWFKNKPRVGGTKALHLEQIRALRPDLIIANKEENDKQQLETLMQEFPVWMSDITTLTEALDMIRSIGSITGKGQKANELAAEISGRFGMLKQKMCAKNLLCRQSEQGQQKINAAYFIWRQPWMVAGKGTFIHEMMHFCGLQNCFGHLSRYPEITLEQLSTVNCQLLLLSSEPFPFKEKHAVEIRQILPYIDIRFVDGEIFSWYGSRMLQAPDYFSRLFIQ